MEEHYLRRVSACGTRRTCCPSQKCPFLQIPGLRTSTRGTQTVLNRRLCTFGSRGSLSPPRRSSCATQPRGSPRVGQPRPGHARSRSTPRPSGCVRRTTTLAATTTPAPRRCKAQHGWTAINRNAVARRRIRSRRSRRRSITNVQPQHGTTVRRRSTTTARRRSTTTACRSSTATGWRRSTITDLGGTRRGHDGPRIQVVRLRRRPQPQLHPQKETPAPHHEDQRMCRLVTAVQ